MAGMSTHDLRTADTLESLRKDKEELLKKNQELQRQRMEEIENRFQLREQNYLLEKRVRLLEAKNSELKIKVDTLEAEKNESSLISMSQMKDTIMKLQHKVNEQISLRFTEEKKLTWVENVASVYASTNFRLWREGSKLVKALEEIEVKVKEAFAPCGIKPGYKEQGVDDDVVIVEETVQNPPQGQSIEIEESRPSKKRRINEDDEVPELATGSGSDPVSVSGANSPSKYDIEKLTKALKEAKAPPLKNYAQICWRRECRGGCDTLTEQARKRAMKTGKQRVSGMSTKELGGRCDVCCKIRIPVEPDEYLEQVMRDYHLTAADYLLDKS